GPVIVDARSGNEPHDIDAVMKAMGFALESATTGPFDEWLAYYRRPVTITNAPPAGMVPTGVVLTEGDAAADMAGEPRPDKPGRSSWAEASAEPAPAEPEAKPPEQAAAEEADRVAETGDTTPSVDPTEPPPNQGEGIHTGQPLLGARRSRAKKSDDAA
ncbi:MAG TPA: hypothetical protein VNU48_00400, partial [Burkholderiaceae bacterium]|nr:hypothetical protein [Burkholderiaceae bacterium]